MQAIALICVTLHKLTKKNLSKVEKHMKSVENLLIFFLKGFIINASGCTKLMQIGGIKDMNEQTLEGCTGFNLIAPVSGTAVPLDQVPDPVLQKRQLHLRHHVFELISIIHALSPFSLPGLTAPY